MVDQHAANGDIRPRAPVASFFCRVCHSLTWSLESEHVRPLSAAMGYGGSSLALFYRAAARSDRPEQLAGNCASDSGISMIGSYDRQFP
jgi:hypothetical protein